MRSCSSSTAAPGVSAIDHQLAKQLRATGKPVFLAVNKIDHPVNDHARPRLPRARPRRCRIRSRPRTAAASIRCSRRSPTPSSKAPAPEPEAPEHDPLFDEPPEDEDAEPDARASRGPLRVAFVGRPNAGKSSLTNRLLGEERSLVHDEAGTTTDPVDAPFSIGGRDYVLVDTAGIRRKARIDADIEKIAVTMALGQIERADVAVLVIDAGLGPAEQDARIAGKIEEAGRALRDRAQQERPRHERGRARPSCAS